MAAPQIVEKLAIDGGRPLRTRPFGPQWVFGEGDKRQLVEVIENAQAHGWRNRIKVEAFEKAFAEKHGVRHAKAVNTGTSACHTAIAAIDPEPGDEVITTPVTAIGTVSGIVLQNAIPVFADMDPDTFNIDPADIERKITARTRAIMIVHLFGNPCDMDAILAIGRSHGIPVIEDCSQSHLARYQGRLVGTMGDIGVFSLGGKTLTTDQGGMVITDNDDLFERSRDFARGGGESLGDAHRFTNLEAAVGLAQIEGWDEATRVRLRTAAILDEVLEGLPGFTPQKVRPGDVNSYYVYGYKIEEAEAGVSSCAILGGGAGRGHPRLLPPLRRRRPDVQDRHVRQRAHLRPLALPIRRRAGQAPGRLHEGAPSEHRERAAQDGVHPLPQLLHRRGRPRHSRRHEEGVGLLRASPIAT